MDPKQKETAQNEPEKSTPAVSSTNCDKCQRALSVKTGQCYYCSEADPEAIKNLNFLMLDWQRQAAKDPETKATRKFVNILSVLFAMSAASSLVMSFSSAGTAHFPSWLFIIIAFTTAFMGWCFHFNSQALLCAVLLQMAAMFFYMSLAFKSLPSELLNAFFCGFVATLSTSCVLLITLRIFKNKAIQL
jgi:hypothetical protein